MNSHLRSSVRLPILLTILLALAVLTAACGGQSAGATPTAPLPVGPALPRQAPTAGSSPNPAAETIVFPNVPRQTFTFDDGSFAIDYPKNWQAFPQQNGVIFVDPTLRAAYGVLFTQAEGELPTDARADFARQFVQTNYGSEPNFSILSAEGDTVQFQSDDPNLGTAITEISIAQHQTRVFFTQVMVAAPLWAHNAADIHHLADSLRVFPDNFQAAAPTPTPDVPPAWVLFTHPEQYIAFLYPSNWVISHTQTSALAAWPDYQFAFSVEVFPAEDGAATTEQVEAFIQQQADNLPARLADVQQLPVTPYQVGQTTGYTVDYLYNTADGTPTAASIIAVGVDANIYLVSISAPAAAYEEALTWFNPMMQSFKVLPRE